MFSHIKLLLLLTTLFLLLPAKAFAGMMYWNLFNIEGEAAVGAQYVTYATRDDMLNDNNRLGVFNPDGGNTARNIVGSGSDGSSFWSLFNIEGEAAVGAQYVSYNSADDMLNDNNRLGVFNPNGGNIARNIVGSGSDGDLYWSLFNIEGEAAVGAQYVTYASLDDMLNDDNRLGVFNPNGGNVARNIVGSGSDGDLFWSLFNIEGEAAVGAQYVTYASLSDMLNDANRLGVFNPDGGNIARNIVGSGAFMVDDRVPVAEPDLFWCFILSLFAVRVIRQRTMH